MTRPQAIGYALVLSHYFQILIVEPATPATITIHGFRLNLTIRKTIAIHAGGEMMGMISMTSAERKTTRYIIAIYLRIEEAPNIRGRVHAKVSFGKGPLPNSCESNRMDSDFNHFTHREYASRASLVICRFKRSFVFSGVHWWLHKRRLFSLPDTGCLQFTRILEMAILMHVVMLLRYRFRL